LTRRKHAVEIERGGGQLVVGVGGRIAALGHGGEERMRVGRGFWRQRELLLS
jgi:hypothetical protein